MQIFMFESIPYCLVCVVAGAQVEGAAAGALARQGTADDWAVEAVAKGDLLALKLATVDGANLNTVRGDHNHRI